MDATDSSYPARFTFDPPQRIANWRPLVQWLLAIPHLAIVYVLGSVSGVLAIISWFAVLFTGRLPVGLANFQAMYLRVLLAHRHLCRVPARRVPAVQLRDDTRRPWR